MAKAKITENERRFLRALDPRQPGNGLARDYQTMPVLQAYHPELADRSPQGLHQTGASVVRNGWATKRCNHSTGRLIAYKITAQGQVALDTLPTQRIGRAS